MGRTEPNVLRIGYFGSYARGDWGVGSDLDLVIVVREACDPPTRRGSAWDVTELPVPADVLVYTLREWEEMEGQGRLGRTFRGEVVWVYVREEG
ncbi:MAG: nucleotidyltransferase domain-containing protein [Candidatus Bipolaricaulaceae bacterium]